MFNTSQYAQDFFVAHPKGVFVVTGPTASGKTGLAIEIAKSLGDAEIVNSDSRQVYTDLSLLVAAPTEEEKKGIPHHLFEYLSPEKTQNVAEWREAAEEKILEIQSRGKKVILCGGTGLFINALTKNFSLSVPPNQKFRDKMEKFSGQELWEMLHQKDPQEAQNLSPNNKKYILRALEIHEAKGKKSEVMTTQQPKFQFCFLGITHPRQTLYNRINTRNEIMINEGVITEVKKFLEKFPNIPETDGAFIAHGVPEIIQYFSGTQTPEELEKVTTKMKQHTRNYAKRQLTWWRKDERVRWVSGETGKEISIKNAPY